MKSAFNAKVASTEFSVKLVENALTLVRSRLIFQRLNGEQRIHSNSKRHFSSSRPSLQLNCKPFRSTFRSTLKSTFRSTLRSTLRTTCSSNPRPIQQLKLVLAHPITCRHLTSAMDLSNNKETFARILWRSADCVCFDVDSTVCRDEAIDELARFAGKEKQVQELTKQAMKGSMTFFEALEHRLELIQPNTKMVEDYLETHPPRFTPGIKDLVALLHLRGVDVFLVSGGFKSLIEPVAKELNIPLENVFANRLKFYFDGTYAGFDENEPTSHQDGKARVVKFLKEKYGYERVIMVGDGSTDLAACPPADAFIGFGGNQIREKVKKEAHWFAMSFKEMLDALNSN